MQIISQEETHTATYIPVSEYQYTQKHLGWAK